LDIDMETYILDRNNYSVKGVLNSFAEGKRPLCPVCKSPILIATDPQQARELGIPPGMQCSKAPQHFQVEFILKIGGQAGSANQDKIN
jgi:hypothetical protein